MYSILTCAVFDLHSIYCLRNRPAYRPHPQTTSTNEQKWILYFWSDTDYVQQSLGSGDWDVAACQLIASNPLNDRRLPQPSALMTSARARRTGLQLHGLFRGFIVILYALNEALIRGRNAAFWLLEKNVWKFGELRIYYQRQQTNLAQLVTVLVILVLWDYSL